MTRLLKPLSNSGCCREGGMRTGRRGRIIWMRGGSLGRRKRLYQAKRGRGRWKHQGREAKLLLVLIMLNIGRYFQLFVNLKKRMTMICPRK